MLGQNPNTAELTGMDAVKNALQAKPPKERSIAWLARQLGLSRGALLHWEKIPDDYLEEITAITGVPARVLRPDLAELFDRGEAN